MPASFHSFTTKVVAKGIIRHAGLSVKTHPEIGFLSGTALVAAGWIRGRETITPCDPTRSFDARHARRVPAQCHFVSVCAFWSAELLLGYMHRF
jgi:hypothetical protein